MVETAYFRFTTDQRLHYLKGAPMVRRSILSGAVLASLVYLAGPSPAAAQPSKSAAVAKELVQVLDQKKLDSIAAKLPSGTDLFAAALYFPGVQLLVVSGQYTAPQLLDPKLAQKQYRDTYLELSGTVTPASKIFVQDMGDPGLSQKKQDGMFDTWTQAGKPIVFDGEPDKQEISHQDYLKRFTAADEEYARILGALLTEAKK